MRLRDRIVRTITVGLAILLAVEAVLFFLEYFFFDLSVYDTFLTFMMGAISAVIFAIVVYVGILRIFKDIESRIENTNVEIISDNNVMISTTDITEIDYLINKIRSGVNDDKRLILNIEKLSKFFKSMMGIFEIDEDKKILTTSKQTAEILKIGKYDEIEDAGIIITEEYSRIENEIERVGEANFFVYYAETEKGRRWINIFLQREQRKIYGFVMDVTNQILEKKMYNYEVGLDSVAGVCSFDEFMVRLKELLLEPVNYSCFVTIELKMLKSINDSYGYRVGDEYIRKFAEKLIKSSLRALFGKKSGYEFLMFSCGFYSVEDIHERITEWNAMLENTEFVTPDGKKYKYKIAAGYCIYPDHTNTIENMIKYSSYALYESKKIFGGVLHEFNMESYSRDEFMKRQVKKFYEIVENNDIYYEFQPIVSLLDGNVFGYEAFMRTNDAGIFSAEKMLEIAESENMGYAIEKMTVFNCARMIKENRDIFKDRKLFYNTIINRSLTDMDMQEYNDEYSSIGYLMIPEIRASDNEGEVFEKCMQLMKGDGRKAIDHFMGKYLDYNRLTAAGIHYFKLDRNIIADIFVKKERQALVNTVVKEVKKHNAITIAVGVESREELRVLVELGVDFAQGYYISVPKKNFTKDIRTEIKNEILELNQLRKFTE
ncbi:MAG: GGDEF domain-containing protein [Firmicutes bacterium]|nr:GGDEF domain-containing protein [Bacillota bacterium]